jgi:transposase-like protein
MVMVAIMAAQRKYSQELKDRAVHLVFELPAEKM